MIKDNMYKVVLIIGLIVTQHVKADIKLPAIISSNMVMQRDTEVIIWGWSHASENLSIKASWLENSYDIKADNSGKWRIKLRTTKSLQPQTISISCNHKSVELDNILFGEVWLCSGQSNMEQPVKGYYAQPTFGANVAIAYSKNSNLRLFTVDKHNSTSPLEDVKKYSAWQEASPANVGDFSAVAYFFGQQLQQILGCPVGLINTSWGASSIEAWTSEEVLGNLQEVTLKIADEGKPQQIHSSLFNAMVNPLIPFAIKGVLWYQGEANIRDPDSYKKLLPAMVKDWRTRWGGVQFPFYYVQIAPYSYGKNRGYQKFNNAAFLREAQQECLDVIPNTGMVVTLDIGDEKFIHPPRKKEVADRLLWLALNNTYQYKSIDSGFPRYHSMEKVEGGLKLAFKDVPSGLFSFGELEGFEIAGSDKIFYPAQAKIENKTRVLVSSNKVTQPIAVRYGWRSYIKGTLYGANLLPASSFRTDDWDDALHAE